MLQKGDRVEMTEEALCQRLQGRNDRRTGIVVGRSLKYPESVRVLRDGSKYAELYHESFWRKVDDDPTAPNRQDAR